MSIFKNIKREIVTQKFSKDFDNLIKSGKAKRFDEEFFNSFDGMYYNALPVSYYLKRMSMGHCYDASAILGLAMGKDCFVCRGNLANMACIQGDDDFEHGWVEKDDKVFDTTWQVVMQTQDYYKLFGVDSVCRREHTKFFEDCKEISCFEIHDKKYYEENYIPFARESVMLARTGELMKLEYLPKDNVEERIECESILNKLPDLDLMPRVSMEDFNTLHVSLLQN